jgi:hypothetical protein
MNSIPAWLDNPIFVKHMRSRLRKSQFYSSAVVVLVLCFFDAYAGWSLNWYSNGGAYSALLGLQSIILAIMGASQIAAAVGGARESGILDFHRVSPLSPLSVTLGFFFGAPIREYALFAITLPFSLLCVWFGSLTIGELLTSLLILILTAWLLHSLAILIALMAKKPKSAGQAVVGLVVFFYFIISGIFSGMRSRPGGLALGEFRFFGVTVSWLVTVALYTLPAIGFFLLAATRKMHSDRAHPYAKRETIAFLAVEAVLIIGGIWSYPGNPVVVFFVLYALIFLACILTMAMTPNLGEYAKGVRRAERRGIAHLGYWDDLALNRVALSVLCLIVLAGSTIAWYFIAAKPPEPGFNPGFGQAGLLSYRTPIATGVLVVAYFGLALQYFVLTAPRRGTTIMGLFLFFVWLVPLVIALFIGLASGSSPTADFIAALSPITGLVLSSRVGDSFSVEAAALGPALAFTFLFNNLVTSARRKVIKAIHSGRDRIKPEPVPDPLAGDESDLIMI